MAPSHPAIPPVLLAGFLAIVLLVLVGQAPDSPGLSNSAEFLPSIKDRSGSQAQGTGAVAGGGGLTIFNPPPCPEALLPQLSG